MTSHAADRLLDAIDRTAAPVCVGIDPVRERLPRPLTPRTRSGSSAVAAIRAFVLGVLDAVTGHVPCVKFQSACFERYRAEGIGARDELIGEARRRGLEVILDAKRGDIGISAEHYAAAAFDHDPSRPDWVTINAYLGQETIMPFLREGRGAFALVRTSNPGGDVLQAQPLADGRTVAECLADIVAAAGAESLGKSGYSSLGAVVGATKPADAVALRQRMPHQIFLVPGYGAQGGGPDDVLPCFHHDGRGAIVSAGRSVIYAFPPETDRWEPAVTDAARRFADEVGRAVGLR